MVSLNAGALIGFGLLALLGLGLVASDPGPSFGPDATVVEVVSVTAGELAGVSGLQEVPGGEWEEKCCQETTKCTADLPATLPPRVSWCALKQALDPAGIFRVGCQGGNGAWVCSSLVGSPAKDMECVAPPPGSILVPSCRPGAIEMCQQYRDGFCNRSFLGGYCVCDLNEAVKNALGKKTCVQGSTPCSGIVGH